jgi:hypothetical protein
MTMSYVPGDRYDTFLSYSALDDAPPPGSTRGGRISVFCNKLFRSIRKAGQRSYSMYTDRHEHSSLELTAPDAPQQRAESFIAMVSPNYLNHSFCMKEMEFLLEHVSAKPHANRRAIRVEIRPTSSYEVPKALKTLPGYRLWEPSNDNNEPLISEGRSLVPYGRLYGGRSEGSLLNDNDERYGARVDRLASQLVDLKRVLAEPDSAAVTSVLESAETCDLLAAEDVAWIHNKRELGEYDVFMCHNFRDKPAVREIGKLLIQKRVAPWLDEWDLRPGLPWQAALETQIESLKSAAVFVGQSQIGPWQNMELAAFLREFTARQCPVIPTILPGCENIPRLPTFLRGFHSVDFRKTIPEPVGQLVWGITGKRPSFKY